MHNVHKTPVHACRKASAWLKFGPGTRKHSQTAPCYAFRSDHTECFRLLLLCTACFVVLCTLRNMLLELCAHICLPCCVWNPSNGNCPFGVQCMDFGQKPQNPTGRRPLRAQCTDFRQKSPIPTIKRPFGAQCTECHLECHRKMSENVHLGPIVPILCRNP